MHQVNLEYLCQVVQEGEGFIYPDSVVGTDSHTTMINGLGILGWGKHDVSYCVIFVHYSVLFILHCPLVLSFRSWRH